jgi:hypothetical protein
METARAVATWGRQPHSYQRNQLPTTPDHEGHDQKDKEARGEQLATGMSGRRKVKIIIRFAFGANGRLRCCFSALRCYFSAQSASVRMGHVIVSGIYPTLNDRDTKRFVARDINSASSR